MKKLFYSLMILGAGLFATNQAIAQENLLSAGLEIALPLGDMADANNLGFGASLGYEIGFTDNVSGLITAGYVILTNDFDGVNTSQVPAQLGIRYYTDEQRSGFFGQVDAGIHLMMASYDTDLVEDQSDARFSAAPEVGYFLTENISIGLRYQMIFIPSETIEMTIAGQTFSDETEAMTLSYLGLRAAFNF